MRLLWLADVLRAAGLSVVEVSGWRDRGADTFGPVLGIVAHETRGSATSSDAGEVNVLVNGREGLSGPIAQLYLSRTGTWHVVASGTCHHVKIGWGGPFTGRGNDSLIGVEAAHAASEDWASKPAQYRSYVRGVAAIAQVVGHREHQPGDKPDPEFDLRAFRNAVAAELLGGSMEAKDVWELDGIPAARPPYNNDDYATNKTWQAKYALQVAVEGARAANANAAAAVTAAQEAERFGRESRDAAKAVGEQVVLLAARIEQAALGVSDAQLPALADLIADRLLARVLTHPVPALPD